MGDVKEEVKGTPKKTSSAKTDKDAKNLVQRASEIVDDVSELVVKKDEDTLKEGDSAKAENMRKAGVLRAASTMFRTALKILEDY